MYFFLALVFHYFICHVSTQEDSHSRALVSTGATGAVAPELFEEHIGQKQIFCDISKILLVKK